MDRHVPEQLPYNFAGLPPQASGYDAAKVVILPAPWAGTLSWGKGTELGPAAVIDASRHMETFDEELLVELADVGIHTLDQIDFGGCSPTEAVERVRRAAQKPIADGKFLLTLGGEHSVAIGPLSCMAESGRKIGVLQIDAHLDLRDEFEGTRLSHACAMRRVIEDCGLPVTAVGIRSFSAEEHAYVVKRALRPWTMQRIRARSDWIDGVVRELPRVVYISLDVDGLDPAVMPGTGTPEPGGLFWADLLALFRAVADRCDVAGADVTEVCPIAGQAISEFTAARICGKLIAHFCT